MNLIEQPHGGDHVPAIVAAMEKLIVSAGMKCGKEIGDGISKLIDKIIDAVFE